MLKILARNHKNEKWQTIEATTYEAESELQHFIAKEPSLIAVNEVREGSGSLVAIIREFPLNTGSIDILGFTQDGQIVIIECKLAKNNDLKRKVIGQLFEYGAGLWGMDYDSLDKRIIQKTNKTLIEFIRQKIEDPNWDEDGFRTNIIESLKDGSFVLMVIVDEMNEDLKSIIQYINNSGNPAFSIAAFEMKRFQLDETEILVPHVHGLFEKETLRKTQLQSEYIDFFGKCIDSLNKQLPKNYPPPSPLCYYRINTGLGNIHYEWGFHGQPRSSFGVEIHMEKGNREQNIAIYDVCIRKKNQLEDALSEKLIFQKDWGKFWSRIYIEKQEGKMNNELKDWAVEKMKIMIDILQPELDKLRAGK